MRRITRHPSLLRSVPLHSRSQLPKRPGVYYATQARKPWVVLYIGMAGDMHQRWTATGQRRHHKLEDLQSIRGVRLHFRTTRNRKMAKRLEAIEIIRYNPPKNGRIEPLIVYPLWDAVDFVCDLGLVVLFGMIAAIALKVLRVV